MNQEIAKKVADAVLYEGYMLYPYRPSAIKNRQRWTFGILYPPAFAEVRSGTERSAMHAECLFEVPDSGATSSTAIHLQLRFLHLVARQVEKLSDDLFGEARFAPVPSLVVDGHRVESWDEAVERSVEFDLASLAGPQQQLQFRFPCSSATERLRDRAGRLRGRIQRVQHEVTGTLSVSAQEIKPGVFKLTVDIANDVAWNVYEDDADAVSLADHSNDRSSALLRSLLSAHAILNVNGGEFVSLLDPPAELRHVVSTCKNVGNFPVLVGAPPEREMMFCSPIVLYDYPQIAPESASNFYDSTEMDEMLTLRVLTLTEEEKSEMRLADDRVRNLLQRTEQDAREQLIRTHGTIRSLRPADGKP